MNLRPGVVAVGPLADRIRLGTGLSATATGLLTTLPLVCFGAFAAAAPALARRTGYERAVLMSVGLIVAGIAARLLSPVVALFAGSAVAGTGIALANVLLPAIIKRDLASRVGSVMGLYSLSLQSGAALAAGLTVPLSTALDAGWRQGLALWGIPAAAAVVLWAPRALRVVAAPEREGPRYAVWRSSLCWAVAGFIGLQSLVYFALTAWLPSLLRAHGMSSSRAGLMLSLVNVAGIPAGLSVPVLAARLRAQRVLVAFTAGTFLVGLIGLLAAPVSGAIAWMVALGLGQGSGISLALTLFALRCRTAGGTAQLSGMAQTVGYLVASTGPLIAGALHDLTGAWTVPVVFLIIVLAGLLAAGWAAASPRTLEDEACRYSGTDPHPPPDSGCGAG